MPKFLNPITVTVPSGTAPFIVNSSTQVTNLNSDYLDGYHGSYYLDTSATSQTKSGILTIGGDLFANSTVQAGFSRLKVLDYNLNGTPTNGIRIATTIPQTNGIGMYTLIFEGYRYGDSRPEMWTLSFYLYDTGSGVVFLHYGASSHAGAVPGLQLGFVGGFVNIFLTDKVYFRRFTIRSIAGGQSETAGHFTGWTVSDSTVALSGATGVVTPVFINQFGSVEATGTLSVSGEISANGGLSSTTGTFSGAVQVNNNSGIRVSYDGGGSYAWLYGYGVEFGRDTSYIRPTTNRALNLFVGSSVINVGDWANIDFYSSGRFNINDNAILHAGNYSSYSPTLTGGGASGSWAIDITGLAAAVAVADTRSAVTTPQSINKGVAFDFKQNATEGLTDGGTYFGEMTFRQYGSGTDWSGGLSHQLGFTDNGNIWQRSGSSTTWGAWKKLLDTTNFSNHALPLTGGTLSDNLTINGNITSGAGYQVKWSDGSAAAPGYSFYADLDTGIHRSADNTLALVTGGVIRVTIENTGNLTATGIVAGSSFSGAGTGLTGTAASLTAGAVAWSGVTGKPTTLSGYGITDALPLSGGTVTGTIEITGGERLRIFRDGSAAVVSHIYWANAANTRAYNLQLDENNSAALWGYNGSAWAKLATISSAGDATIVGTATVKSNGTRTGTALVKFAQTIGDNYATSFNVDHNLGTTDVAVQIIRVSDGSIAGYASSIVASTTNRVVVTFGAAPSTNQYRIVVIG